MLNKYQLLIAAATIAAVPLTSPVFGQSAQTVATTSSGTFDVFMRPDLMQALSNGDYATLNADRLNTIIYLGKMVGALEAPDAWFRMGQEAVLMMDPKLGRILATKLMTDQQTINDAMSWGFGMFLGGLEPFVEKRKETVATDTFDPAGEMAALMRGALGSSGGMGSTMAEAEYDANKLILLAQADPGAFVSIYESIRSYVYFGM
jgi:hypothetical protein